MSGCHDTRYRCAHGFIAQCELCLINARLENLENIKDGLAVEPYLKLLSRIEKLEKRLNAITENHKCTYCKGTGYTHWQENGMIGGSRCKNCQGIGRFQVGQSQFKECSQCNGVGRSV